MRRKRVISRERIVNILLRLARLAQFLPFLIYRELSDMWIGLHNAGIFQNEKWIDGSDASYIGSHRFRNFGKLCVRMNQREDYYGKIVIDLEATECSVKYAFLCKRRIKRKC